MSNSCDELPSVTPSPASDETPAYWCALLASTIGSNRCGTYRCGAVSEVLARILQLEGYAAHVVQGNVNGIDHMWVEVDGKIFDPTVAQFGSASVNYATNLEEKARPGIDMSAKCEDCGRLYGDEYGFPDLVVPKAAWESIMPGREGGGLLCPSCMCKCGHAAGLDCRAVFRSGPFADMDAEPLDPRPASGETQEARSLLDMPAFIEGLRERAKNARAEKTGTAIGDAMCFERSADALEAANAKVAQAERENFALAADQCHDSYAGEHGEHRCRLVDSLEARIAELEAKLATAAEDGLDNLYSDALYDRDNSSDEIERALGSYASDWLHSAGAMHPADRLASRSRNGGHEA